MRFNRDEIKAIMASAGLNVDESRIDEVVSAYGHVEVILDRAKRSWAYLDLPANDFNALLASSTGNKAAES